MDESALWGKIPQGKSAVPLWYTTRIFPLRETQRAKRSLPRTRNGLDSMPGTNSTRAAKPRVATDPDYFRPASAQLSGGWPGMQRRAALARDAGRLGTRGEFFQVGQDARNHCTKGLAGRKVTGRAGARATAIARARARARLRESVRARERLKRERERARSREREARSKEKNAREEARGRVRGGGGGRMHA